MPRHTVTQDSRLVEKRGCLVGFPGPPTCRDEYTHTHSYISHRTIHLLSTYMYVIFPSYVLDVTGAVHFLIVLILSPLLVVMACQGDFDEDHFRCQQPQCGCSPAVSLTGRVLFARWQPLSFTFPRRTDFVRCNIGKGVRWAQGHTNRQALPTALQGVNSDMMCRGPMGTPSLAMQH